MSGSYTPQPGSAAFQAVEYFTTHREDRLTTEQLAEKFGKPSKQWHSILGPAVQAKVLIRTTNAEGDMAYALGSGTPGVAPAPHRHPSARPDALLAGAEVGAKPSHSRVHGRPPDIDIATIPLRTGVPLPVAVTGKSRWPALLARMEVGQSCVLPKAFKGGVAGAVTDAKKAGKVFAIRAVNDEEFGLWRVS